MIDYASRKSCISMGNDVKIFLIKHTKHEKSAPFWMRRLCLTQPPVNALISTPPLLSLRNTLPTACGCLVLSLCAILSRTMWIESAVTGSLNTPALHAPNSWCYAANNKKIVRFIVDCSPHPKDDNNDDIVHTGWEGLSQTGQCSGVNVPIYDVLDANFGHTVNIYQASDKECQILDTI